MSSNRNFGVEQIFQADAFRADDYAPFFTFGHVFEEVIFDVAITTLTETLDEVMDGQIFNQKYEFRRSDFR